jgi:hypothetical protein
MIKAIQTRYAGYLFRSRLEARWAVFFDALKLDWKYEPEGFELPSRKYYLPDFKINLRRGHLWIDVKPNGVWCPELVELIHAAPSNWTATVLNDIPDPRTEYAGHEVWFGCDGDSSSSMCPTAGMDCFYTFCTCKSCGEVGFEFSHEAGRIGCGCGSWHGNDPRIAAAFAAARSARFEHDHHERYIGL